jgi:hypothetical protein
MGFNTTIVILNDALHELEKDEGFSTRLLSATLRLSVKEPQDVSIGNHVNACQVVETHHAGGVVPVLVGGNCGIPVRGVHVSSSHDVETMELDLLRELARKHGFVLRRKRA